MTPSDADIISGVSLTAPVNREMLLWKLQFPVLLDLPVDDLIITYLHPHVVWEKESLRGCLRQPNDNAVSPSARNLWQICPWEPLSRVIRPRSQRDEDNVSRKFVIVDLDTTDSVHVQHHSLYCTCKRKRRSDD